jgi:prepilin-type N-terminal cleavage/methylation domain-containing protein
MKIIFKTPKVNLITGGFSFIELLVVISVMALFFSLGFANFRSYQGRQKIISAERAFKADLRYAQEQALAGKKPPGAICNQLNGYSFEYVSATEYEVLANCDSNIETSVKTGDLSTASPSVEFQAPFSSIFFNVLGRGVRMSGSEIPIVLTNTDSLEMTTVTVTKGGEVK